jgi:hypothetical protein
MLRIPAQIGHDSDFIRTGSQSVSDTVPILFGQGSGSYSVIDGFGLVAATGKQNRDLVEILDDRHSQGATVITSQFPVSQWHDLINDATVADAILDRLVHNAYRIELKGESLRKKNASRTGSEE